MPRITVDELLNTQPNDKVYLVKILIKDLDIEKHECLMIMGSSLQSYANSIETDPNKTIVQIVELDVVTNAAHEDHVDYILSVTKRDYLQLQREKLINDFSNKHTEYKVALGQIDDQIREINDKVYKIERIHS